MGIISFIKGGVAELAIARPDSAKDYWVYKHPDQTIPMKAQLTVDSDEVALFFKDGKFVGSFSAGRHTLDASNIPFLGQLVDKFTGGNVFICEVFFVTTRDKDTGEVLSFSRFEGPRDQEKWAEEQRKNPAQSTHFPQGPRPNP